MRRKKRLYSILSGGLGNQLFMFASAFALAMDTNRVLQLNSAWFKSEQRTGIFRDHRREFDLRNIIKLNYFDKLYSTKNQKIVYFVYKLSLKNTRLKNYFPVLNMDYSPKEKFSNRNLIIHGYLQEPENFIRYRDNLIEIIGMNESAETTIKAYLASIRRNNERLIALHVRRGDYTLATKNKNLLTLDYYQQCLELLDVEKNRTLVFSDDIEWCKSNLQVKNCVYIEEKDPVYSLTMMRHCDDFIVSPSTFSWWGAWLSSSDSKRVIVPSPYNEESDEIWKNLPQPGWIKVKASFVK